MKEKKHLGSLDGLRGAMALWVVIGHTGGNTGMALPPILGSPRYAVDGFMMLSGFLMTFHYILRESREPWTHPLTWLTFYVRRSFRICPLYYTLLVPCYLFFDSLSRWRGVLQGAYQQAIRIPELPPVSYAHVLFHLSFLFGLLPKYHSSLTMPDWSLSLEMQFYLAFPFLMLFVLRFGWVAFCLASGSVWVFATQTAFARSFVQPSPLPLSLLWFAIGMVWAGAYINIQKGKSQAWLLAWLGALLSLVSRDVHDIILVAFLGWVLFAEGKFTCGHLAGRIRELLSGRISGFLAEASYSVYLLHLIVLVPIAYFLCAYTHFGPRMRFAIAFAVTGSISYALAIPMAVIERFGISLGKRFSEEMNRLHPPAIQIPPRQRETPTTKHLVG